LEKNGKIFLILLYVKLENHHFLVQKKGFVFCLQIFILNEIIYFSRPFREININNNSKSWDRVYKLQKGKVYVEVNFI
jgi:hypothetical protein